MRRASASFDVERVLTIGCGLGEDPIWSVENRALFWLDIHRRYLHMLRPDTAEHKSWQLPATPGCFALQDRGRSALIAAQDGFYSLQLESSHIGRVFDVPFDSTSFRFNDGKPDRQGRLLAGSVAANVVSSTEPRSGCIYGFNGAQLLAVIAPITVANGIAFSVDGKTLYRAESLQRRILAYDYDPVLGTVSRERLFVTIPEHLGFPDGATVDRDGCYWIALPFGKAGGGVGRYTPGGELDTYIPVPVTLPTMVAFGGDDMSTLFVTSACDPVGPPSTSRIPLGDMAGDLFCIQTPFEGVPEATFEYSIG